VSPLANGSSCTKSIGQLQVADPFSAEWNDRLAEYSDATIFHTTEWARVLQDSYGYTSYYFRSTGADGAKLLCLFEIDSWLTGRRAVSLPFADETVPLGIDSSDEIKRVINEISPAGREKRWKRIEVRGAPRDWSGPTSNSYYSHELDLSGSIETLFKNCSDSARRAIRKAERSGVKVEIRNDREALEEYFELHCLTRKKHGVPPQPLYFFQNIQRHIIAGGLGFTALARLNGRALAGAVFFIFREKALYKFGASDPSADLNRPSNLVMWHGIKEAKERGAASLAFGRTDLNHDGLRRYKLGWGTKEKTISYLQFDVVSETFLSGRNTSRSNPLLRILPSWMLKRLGAAIYPHIG
jgi:CelD/BcsL family acetyltransferase involved in cellulose biosynthesis